MTTVVRDESYFHEMKDIIKKTDFKPIIEEKFETWQEQVIYYN